VGPQTIARRPKDVAWRCVRREPESLRAARRPGFTKLWDRLTAVKSGRAWEFQARMVKRPGPDVLDALERVKEVLSAAGGPQQLQDPRDLGGCRRPETRSPPRFGGGG